MSDTHKELRYARYDARHRLVTGGALLAPINAAERLRRVLAARLRAMWPQIGDLAFDYVWNCQVAMTWDQHGNGILTERVSYCARGIWLADVASQLGVGFNGAGAHVEQRVPHA